MNLRRVLQVVAAIGVIAITISMFLGWGHSSEVPLVKPTATVTAPSASASVQTPTDRQAPQLKEAYAGLNEAVYAFEEAFWLPESPQRTAKLRAMSTPAGFQSLSVRDAPPAGVPVPKHYEIRTDPSQSSIGSNVIPPSDGITPGPEMVSVTSRVTLLVKKDDQDEYSIRPVHTTVWSKSDNMWKLEYLQL